MPLVRFLRVVYVCGNLSCWPDRVRRTLPLPPDTISSTSVDRSTGPPPSFSPNTTIEAVIKGKHLSTTCYVSLLGLYLRHVISTFNTCSRGPTHRFLTNTGRGYKLRGAGLPHHTSRSSQPMVLRFPHKHPVRSQVNPSTTCLQLNQEVINLNSYKWDPPLDFYHSLSSKHSIANSKPPRW
jgi:hypothetical protein